MPDTQFFSQQAAMRKATLIQGGLANSKLRLIKDPLSFSDFTTKAQLEAAEADFDGYPAGGYALAAFQNPVTDPQGGAIITSPLVQVAFGTPSDPPIPNNLHGYWIEDATGNVRLIGTWNPSRPVQQAGDGFALVVQMVEGRNAPIPLE